METLQENLPFTILQFVPFMMAVVFHEWAHGFMAHQHGDDTAKSHGRLTLNPLPHIDVLGTLVFPLLMMLSGGGFLFGWAKPVPINPSRFKKFRPGLFWVSAAGPLMNVFLAILSAVGFALLNHYMDPEFYLHKPLIMMAAISVSMNYALAIFNLLPIPPLDGSKIVESFLSYRAAQKYEVVAQYSFWILMALMLTGALSILGAPIRWASQWTLGLATYLLG